MASMRKFGNTEFAISSIHGGNLAFLTGNKDSFYYHWMTVYKDAALASWLSELEPTHVYLGSEFCEHLLPESTMIRKVIRSIVSAGYHFVLLTPISSPGILEKLNQSLPALPEGTEVVVNDWGVAHFIRKSYPRLKLIAGRILCRTLKEPRTDTASRKAIARFDPESWLGMLDYFEISRMEVDVPLDVNGETFTNLPRPTSIHIPFTCVAKGRMCKLGSLNNNSVERFSVGQKCNKECLYINSSLGRQNPDGWSELFQSGNTILNRLPMSSIRPVIDATITGAITRIIVPGEFI
jgi:hypothetical protein